MALDPAELSEALEACAVRAPERAAWCAEVTRTLASECPQLALPAAALAEHLALRTARGVPLTRLLGSDLALALGAARGDKAAVAWLEKSLLPRVRPALARVVGEAKLDEGLQRVRERLLLPDAAGQIRLETYEGLAPLTAWARAVAVRVGLNHIRRPRPEAEDEALLEQAPAALDLEGEVLRAVDAQRFAALFRQSLAALTPRERTLLKLYFVDGLSVEQVGRTHGVDKSTASRWLAGARKRLVKETDTLLARELGLDPDQVRSLARRLRSRIDLSLSTLLAR
jgi:RNA polymerase sigma-70 factor (ECF subfamily)